MSRHHRCSVVLVAKEREALFSKPFRAAVVVVAAFASFTLGGGIASAHVSVNSAEATPGGYGVVTFRVPNESDSAGTVGLRVQLPEETPFASVRNTPLPGWTVTMTRVTLDPPIENHGQQITEAVSVVTWTAAPGARIGPGEYLDFPLSVGPFPEVDSIVFKAIQTYDDGSEVAWIEETVEGAEEPEHPAPVLSLTADSGATGSESGSGNEQATATAGTGSGLAVAALAVGATGLVVALLGLLFGLQARRRTVER